MSSLKYVFIDVDGTLITDNKEITTITRNELKRIIFDFGVKIFFTSSRMPKSLEELWTKIGLNGGIVGFNGTIIKWEGEDINPNGLKISLLPIHLIKKIIDLLPQSNVSFNIYTSDKWYTNNLNYWTLRELRSTGINPDSIELDEILTNEESEIHKILIRSDENQMKKVIEILYNLKVNSLTSFTLVKPTLVEMTPLGIDKSLAMKAVLQKFKDTRSNTIAFGDGDNDFEMIQFAQIGVVMDNAVPRLKEIADYITLSNNEDGVAVALKRYFPAVRSVQ